MRELLRGDASLANAADPCWRRPSPEPHRKDTRPLSGFCWSTEPDPNAKEPICQGSLALHDAAEKGSIEIVQLLLDKGAVPEHWVDSPGDSLFASRGHPKILHLLYSYGGTMELQVYAAARR